MEKKRGGWGVTYQDVYLMDNLTIESKAIYGMLCSYAGMGATAYPSVEFICDKLHISRARFYKHMNLLIGAGIIEKQIIRNDKGLIEKTIYTLTPNLQNDKLPLLDNLTVDNLTEDNLASNNNTINNNTFNKNTKERGKTTRFIPPTLEEVTEYCDEKGYAISPQQFIDFYESKGWLVGKNKMKDWRAAVRTWVSRQQPSRSCTGATNNRFNNFHQRENKLTDEELEMMLMDNSRKEQ